MVRHRPHLPDEEAGHTSSTLLFRPPTHARRSLRDFQESSGSTSGYILSRACWEIQAGMGKRQWMVTAICQHQVNVCSCEASLMLNKPQERSRHFCTVFEEKQKKIHKKSTSTTSKSSLNNWKTFPDSVCILIKTTTQVQRSAFWWWRHLLLLTIDK